jgi:hypothetical protein
LFLQEQLKGIIIIAREFGDTMMHCYMHVAKFKGHRVVEALLLQHQEGGLGGGGGGRGRGGRGGKGAISMRKACLGARLLPSLSKLNSESAVINNNKIRGYREAQVRIYGQAE